MPRSIKRFIALGRAEQGLFLLAYGILGVMRAAILLLPFKWLSRSLRQLPGPSHSVALSESQQRAALQVGEAVTRAARYTPWNSNCLAQALTAYHLLYHRGIPGVICLGAARDTAVQGKLTAHAWVRAGDTILTGAAGHEAFSEFTLFAWDPS